MFVIIKMLYTNTIIPTVSTSINVVHSAHCAIIVCYVVYVGASADGTGALLKPPCAATCQCETSDHVTGGDPGERTSVTMVILISPSVEILDVGLIELDYY